MTHIEKGAATAPHPKTHTANYTTPSRAQVKVEHWREQGLTLIPLGKPDETPPPWFIDRCDDLEDAMNKWPKTPRGKWKQYQEVPPTDDEVFQWHGSYPHTNWAILTGPQLVVVDCDSPEAIELAEANLPPTPWIVNTARGCHRWYASNPDVEVKNSAEGKSHIDVRGTGGYVVAPGSVHPTGAIYELEQAPGTESDELWQLTKLTQADISWIESLKKPQKRTNVSNVSESGGVSNNFSPEDGVSEGGRNNAAAGYIGTLINQRLSEQEIYKLALTWNGNNRPPLGEDELYTTFRSIIDGHNHRNPESPVPKAPQAPTPLPDLPPVDALPLYALPDALAGFVEDVADRTQCPSDYVAVVALCALAAALGNKATICPKQHDDWEVVPNLWGAIIGRPSAMKSPAMKAALAPMRAREDQWREEHKQELQEYDALSEVADAKKKQARLDTKKNLDKPAAELKKVFADLIEEQPTSPNRKRLIVNDPTVEKLGELLNQNPNGLLLERDELSGLIANLSSKEGQSDRAFYLQLFDGDGRYTVDRIGRGTIDVLCTTLSLVGGIQPSKILPLIHGAVSGQNDDGLVQRLQLAVWPDEVSWEYKDQEPSVAAYRAYDRAINGLIDLPPSGTPRRFTEQAQRLFADWTIRIQRKARAGDVHPSLESYLIKLPQTIAALALIFQLADQDKARVGEHPTRKAIQYADYLVTHAERLYGASTKEELIGARLILTRMSKLPGPFTVRCLTRKQWTGLTDRQICSDAIDLLCDHGYLVRYEKKTGGKPRVEHIWKNEIFSNAPSDSLTLLTKGSDDGEFWH